MKRVIYIFGLMILSSVVIPMNAAAQCPMCKMAAETNMQGGGTAGNGLNAGILYMLIMPYLLVGVIGYVWWRNKNKAKGLDS
jgi:hypothetical protein